MKRAGDLEAQGSMASDIFETVCVLGWFRAPSGLKEPIGLRKFASSEVPGVGFERR